VGLPFLLGTSKVPVKFPVKSPVKSSPPAALLDFLGLADFFLVVCVVDNAGLGRVNAGFERVGEEIERLLSDERAERGAREGESRVGLLFVGDLDMFDECLERVEVRGKRRESSLFSYSINKNNSSKFATKSYPIFYGL